MGFDSRPKGAVYSTGQSEAGRRGGSCPKCGHPAKRCLCSATTPEGDGVVRVSRETKGRKGKGVTIVTGLPLNKDDLKALGKRLRQACGSGGTVKDGRVEIQGDHRDRIVQELEKAGYKPKKAGG